MPEMHLKQLEFTYSACRPFTKNKERIQKFKETGDVFLIELVFNTIRHMEILKIQQKEHLLINFSEINHLILQKILNMTDIKEGWRLWFTNFLIKSPLHVVVSLIMRLNKIYNLQKNYTNQLLETFKEEQFTQNLKTIFGVLIQLICN